MSVQSWRYGAPRYAMLAIASLALTARAQEDAPEAPEVLAVPQEVATEPATQLAPPPAEGLTLPVLESIALSRNPAIARAEALVGAARGECLQVGLKPNPYVGYEGQQLGSGGLAEQHGVVFGQEVVTGGKLRLSRAVAAQRVTAAEQELAAARLRVLTDVRVGYYRVLVAQRQVQLAQELVQLGSDLSESADSLLKAKEVGRVDALQASLEREQAEVSLQNVQQRVDAAWRELTAVVGDPSLLPQSLQGDAEGTGSELLFDEALSRLRSQSPEVAAAAARFDEARLALERERREPIPNVTFQGLVNWRDNGIGGGADGGVAITVPVPVFNRNQGAVFRADRQLVAARQAMSQLDLDLQQRLAPLFETYAAARQQTLRYRETVLPRAEESLKLTRELYQAGELNYTALLVAQRTFAVANQDYLDAVLRLREAEAVIEGLLLRNSLDSGG